MTKASKRSIVDDGSDSGCEELRSPSGNKGKANRRQTDTPKSLSMTAAQAAASEKESRRRHSELPKQLSSKRRSSMERKSSSRRSSEEKTSSRRSSEDKGKVHDKGDERRRSSAEKQRSRHDSAEKPGRQRRQSICDLALTDLNKLKRRQSNDSKKAIKDDMDLIGGSSSRRSSDEKQRSGNIQESRKKSTSPRRFRGSSADGRKPASKSSTGDQQGDKNKPAVRRRQRRPSVDAFAILEYEKRNRRQSNESSFSRKSKDDFDLSRKNDKTSRSRKSNPFGGGRGKSKDKSGGRSASVEKHEHNNKDSNRPKRRSLDKNPSDTRRSSLDSTHQPSHVSSHSRRSGGHSSKLNESLSSFGSAENNEEKASHNNSSSRPKLHRKSSDNSMPKLHRRSSDNGMNNSRPKMHRRNSESSLIEASDKNPRRRSSDDSNVSKSFSLGKNSRPELQRRSSDNNMNNSRPKMQRRNSESSLIKAFGNKKRLSLDPTTSGSFKMPSKVTSKVTESMVVMSEGKGIRRNSSQEEDAVPTSLDTDKLEKFEESQTSHSHNEVDSSHANGDNDDHDKTRKGLRRRYTEKPRKKRLPSRRDMQRSMSMRVRSRSREIKLRAFRRTSSSMSDGDIKANGDDDKDDTLQEDTTEPAHNKRHDQSNRELAQQKSHRRQNSMDKAQKSDRRSSRGRDTRRSRMSIKHVRSRSREIKQRALRMMQSSSSEEEDDEDKEDRNEQLSPEEAYNRQHDQSDGELVKQKSSKRRDSTERHQGSKRRDSMEKHESSRRRDSMEKHESRKRKSNRRRRPSLAPLMGKQSSRHKSRTSRGGEQHRRESSTAQRRRTAESSELRPGSSHGGGVGVGEEHKTEAGQATSELDSYLAKKNRESRRSSRGSTRRSPSRDKDTNLSPGGNSHDDSPPRGGGARYKKSFYARNKWKCLCCCTLFVLVIVAAVVAMVVLQALNGGVSISVNMNGDAKDAPKDGTLTEKPASGDILDTYAPSAVPSMVPTQRVTTVAPTPAPLSDVAIAVIVQLDERPEETGFSLISADNATTYVSMPIGSLAGRQSEVIMEVITIPERTKLVFEIMDSSGDGLCCDHGNGYYRILAGTGDKKNTVVSGERSAKYTYTVGRKHAVQIGGVDPNEYCKPCLDNSKECGRCAWCDAPDGFLPDTIYSWQCRTDFKSIPPKCFVGPKRVQLHDQYVAAMAGCANGFRAWPMIAEDGASAVLDATVCVEEAKCIKSFAFVEPECEKELPGSMLARETCQDKIGGIAFGYSWGLNAPREKDCPVSGKLASALAQRCCSDGVAFCSTIFAGGNEEDGESTPTPSPIDVGTDAPTASNAPTWDGYPITLLIQLDEFPRETGVSITSVMQGQNVTFFERRPGYYKEPQSLAVEKFQIPEGTDAVITLTDVNSDGICCSNGDGYFQIYSNQGSLILDEAGTFETSISKTFFVGEPKTNAPTSSTAPSASNAPTFDQFPITIAVQMDQWGTRNFCAKNRTF